MHYIFPMDPVSMETFGTLELSKTIDKPINNYKCPVVFASASSVPRGRNFNPAKASLVPGSNELLITSDKVALDCKKDTIAWDSSVTYFKTASALNVFDLHAPPLMCKAEKEHDRKFLLMHTVVNVGKQM